MGQTKSKPIKYPQYPLPPGYQPYPVYPYPVPHPQVGYAQGYHAPVIPPGYGAPVVMPQPQIVVTRPSRERRRRKRGRRSPPAPVAAQQQLDQRRAAALPAPPGMLDNLPPGFIPTSITPNPPGASGPLIPPVVPGNTTAQGAPPPPLFTPGGPSDALLTNFTPAEPSTQRRAATPFIPALRDESDDEDESDEDEDQRPSSHGRSRSRSHRRHTAPPLLPHIHPDDPLASPGLQPNPLPQPPRDLYQFSPYKQLVHLPNTMALLTATTTNPQTGYGNPSVTVVRSGTNPGMAGVGAGVNAVQPTVKRKKKFFSFGSLRGRQPQAQPAQPAQPQHQLGNIQFVPIYNHPPHRSNSTTPIPNTAPDRGSQQPVAGPSTGEGVSRYQNGTPVPPLPTPPSPPPQRSPPPDDDDDDEGSDDDGAVPPDAYRSISPVSHHTNRSHHTQHYNQPPPQPQSIYQAQPEPQSTPQGQLLRVRPQSQPPPQSQSQSNAYPQASTSQPYFVSPNGSVMEFSHTSLPDFLNHSSHRVMYRNQTYPSAMHLHEAMKFMDHKPELAKAIRECQGAEEVYPLAAKLEVWVRPDWGQVFVEKMEEVLWHKFTQHSNIRNMLLKTGNSRIVYSDPQDPYWGSGAQFGHGSDYPGTNYLGKLLEKVRDRLRESGYT